MKKFSKFFVAVLIFGLFIVLPVAAQKTEADFQKMYMDYLKKRGYNPEILEDGNVYFQYDGNGFYIFLNVKEPQDFVIFTFVPMQAAADKAFMAAHRTNQNNYGVKAAVFPNSGRVFVSVEHILPKPKDFSLVFDKLMESLVDAALYYLSEVR